MIHSEFSKPHPRIGRDTAQATFRQVNATLGGTRPSGFNWEGEQLHDFVLFAVNTGLRPDEAWRLEFRDVTVADDEDLGKTILEIEVRGKRGVGYCKSMPGAVRPFERLRSRLRPARIYGVNTPEKSSVTMPAIGTSASGTNIWDGPNKPLSRFGVATCPSRALYGQMKEKHLYIGRLHGTNPLWASELAIMRRWRLQLDYRTKRGLSASSGILRCT